MNREEAIAVLKEIVEVCKTIAINQITLKSVTESQGYELNMHDHFYEKDCENLNKLLKSTI